MDETDNRVGVVEMEVEEVVSNECIKWIKVNNFIESYEPILHTTKDYK